MLQKLNVVDDSCEMRIHTCVKEKGGYFEVMTFQFITVIFLLTCVK